MRYLIFFLFLSGCGTFESQRFQSSYSTNDVDPLVLDSLNYLGYDEYNNRRELRSMLGIDPVRTEWCAAFMNYILEKNGYPTSDDIHPYPLLARSFTDYGEDVTGDPQPGDIVVLTRGNSSWQGHVGFFLSTVIEDGNIYYAIVSGNDDDQVKIDKFSITRVITVRRVEDGASAGS